MSIKYIASSDLPVELRENGSNRNIEEIFRLHAFGERVWRGLLPKTVEHAALVYGKPQNGALVRVHSECLGGDVFSALNCDCGRQLNFALSRITNAGSGIVIYMRGHEGRGNGFGNKMKCVSLEQTQGIDTVDAHKALGLPPENRRFDAAVQIITEHFKLDQITLLTNNPIKIEPFTAAGVAVRTRPGWVRESDYSKSYLDTKVARMSHLPSGRHGAHSTNPDEPLLFWLPDEPLANFYLATIEIGGRKYGSVEHFYQAQKFVHHPGLYDLIADAVDPATAKSIAHTNTKRMRSDWEVAQSDGMTVRDRSMRDAMLAKYTQHPGLQDYLLETGNRELVEDSHDDLYWGRTPEGRGLNMAGVLTMQIREELRPR